MTSRYLSGSGGTLKRNQEGAASTLITDPSVTKRMRAVMEETSSLDAVLYKGNYVDPSDKAVLKHLLDEYKDHIPPSYPRIEFNLGRWGFTYKVHDHQLGFGFTKKVKSNYFAVDGIFLDLKSTPASESKVKLIFPRDVYRIMYNRAQLYQAPFEGCAKTRNDSDLFQVVKASFDKTNPPTFVSLREHIGDDDGDVTTDAMILRNEGSLTKIMKSDAHKHLYKITGIFTGKSDWKKNRSHLKLVALRAYSTHDNILQIKKNKALSLHE